MTDLQKKERRKKERRKKKGKRKNGRKSLTSLLPGEWWWGQLWFWFLCWVEPSPSHSKQWSMCSLAPLFHQPSSLRDAKINTCLFAGTHLAQTQGLCPWLFFSCHGHVAHESCSLCFSVLEGCISCSTGLPHKPASSFFQALETVQD